MATNRRRQLQQPSFEDIVERMLARTIEAYMTNADTGLLLGYARFRHRASLLCASLLLFQPRGTCTCLFCSILLALCGTVRLWIAELASLV
jgi:hypothetical protein